MKNKEQAKDEYPYYGHDSEIWAVYVRVIAVGIGGIVLILWGCSYIPEESKDQFWNVFILGSVTWLILVSTWVQIGINKKQWTATQDALERTDSLLEQNERMLEVSKKQARTAHDALRHSKQAFSISERAYLTVKEMNLEGGQFVVGQSPIINFLVKNGGKTPAFKVKGACQMAITNKISVEEVQREMGEPPIAGDKIGNRILPNDESSTFAKFKVVITDTFLTNLRDTRVQKFYVAVHLTLIDFEGIERLEDPFYYVFDFDRPRPPGQPNGSFVLCNA